MSSKHLFPSSDGLVAKALRGAIAYNPALSLIESSKVVFDTQHPAEQVSIISGGGAGHEPAWAGYVGKSMLAASCSGDIFASPSTKAIMHAIEAVPSHKGTILCILNYTGDCLHFGLACEKANAMNKASCGIIICGDDVSVGRKGDLVGRRGLAAQTIVLGAAAAAECSFDDCMSLGNAVSEQIASIAATLDHCHVPGRSEHAHLDEDEIELGTGPHNEPGYRKISPIPPAHEFLGTVLKYILDENDRERGYVHFEKGDEILLLASNFGGLSQLEMGAIADELLEQLDSNYSIQPVRVYVGVVQTSLNAPAFSTSLINLTAAAKNTVFSVDQILEFLDVKTTTQWEAVAGSQKFRRPRKEQIVAAPQEEEKTIDPVTDILGKLNKILQLTVVDPSLLETALKKLCQNISQAEPDLTRWDTQMGDGDCGETFNNGATALLKAVDKGLCKTGSVLAVLHEVDSIIESRMGGTLGGILGIFFVSLTNALQKRSRNEKEPNSAIWGKALEQANAKVQLFTPAKVGDRTIMDVLIPFAKSMASSNDLSQAARAARDAAESTRSLKPRLGRATYVGNSDGKELPPDPGAWGAMIAIEGLASALSGQS